EPEENPVKAVVDALRLDAHVGSMLAQLVRGPLRRHSLARRARSALQRGQALDRGAQAVLDRRRLLRGHAQEPDLAALRIALPHGRIVAGRSKVRLGPLTGAPVPPWTCVS